ncbi:hypothetical protein [Propionicimonas sp.]|uniref:hypothetical protein n=1 Tax=Propionicimonas sp. TaxID=1955623 RepID=UPI0039E2591F
MGRCPPDRRLNPVAAPGAAPPPRRRLAILLAVVLCTSVSCARGSEPSPSPTTTIASRLDAGVRSASQAGVLAVFGPDAQAVGLSLFAVLTAGDATVAGAGDRLLRADYALPGDRRTARETVRYVQAAGSDAVSGLEATSGPLPVWALAGVSVTTTTSGTLVSAGLDASARKTWADRLERAAKVVRRSTVGEDWSGGLVVVIPPGGRFGTVSGASADDASAITTCSAGTPRIIVNPAVLAQSAEWLDSTLVHEAVHVATDSACVAAGASLGWAVEGLAESVAARSDSATAARNRALVVSFLTEHGLPDALPADPESLTDYALAQLAADQVRAHLGAHADDFWRRAIHDADSVTPAEIERITRWYRAALADLA